jgi:hypothetical protein
MIVRVYARPTRCLTHFGRGYRTRQSGRDHMDWRRSWPPSSSVTLSSDRALSTAAPRPAEDLCRRRAQRNRARAAASEGELGGLSDLAVRR